MLKLGTVFVKKPGNTGFKSDTSGDKIFDRAAIEKNMQEKVRIAVSPFSSHLGDVRRTGSLHILKGWIITSFQRSVFPFANCINMYIG